MRTKCLINVKQMALERKFHKLLIYAKKLILSSTQFNLLLLYHLTYSQLSWL